MKHDVEWFKFAGACTGVAEDELGASLNGCSETEYEQFINNLFADYRAAGNPKPLKKWLRDRLVEKFLSVGAPPKWVSGQPAWPWFKGQPMVFLGQLRVPETQTAKVHGPPNVELYVFGTRVATSGGWKMEYKIVEDYAELKGVVALVKSEAPRHTPANTILVKRKASAELE